MDLPSIARRAARVCLGAVVLGLTTPAHAQQSLRIGDFQLQLQTDPITDQDRSVALLYPRGSGREGSGFIMWSCLGSELMSAVNLEYGNTGQRQPVVWRFDSDRPDTTYLMGLDGTSGWFLRDEDLAPFTIRTRTATRLVIRVLGGAPAYRTTDYLYDLTGSASVLNRMQCARNPGLLGRPAHPGEPDAAEQDRPEVAGGTYEASAVEEIPRILNGSALRDAIARNYPPLLRDARVAGTVQVRLRVLEDGSVDEESITVTSSSHEHFIGPTVHVVRTLRFRPGRLNGRPVRVMIEMPIQWSPP